MSISKSHTDKNLIEFLTLSIELGNNKTEYLKIYKDTIPDKLAYNFCLKHNLDFNSLKKLTNEIKNALIQSKKKEKLNNSFEKANKTTLENFSQIKNSNSMKNIHDNDLNSIKNDNNYENNKKKYNFKDISKNLKRPIIYQFKITIKNEQNPKIKNSNKIEKNEYYIGNKSNLMKEDIFCNENKGRIKTSYLSPTVSSRSKIKKKDKNKRQNLNKCKRTKTYSHENIKIINIINNNNVTNSVNNLIKNDNRNNNNNNINLNNEDKKDNKKEKELNIGEKLYLKSIKLKEISMEKAKNKINQKEKEEQEQCTFKPKINTVNIKSIKFNKNKNFNKEGEKSIKDKEKNINKKEKEINEKKEEKEKENIINKEKESKEEINNKAKYNTEGNLIKNRKEEKKEKNIKDKILKNKENKDINKRKENLNKENNSKGKKIIKRAKNNNSEHKNIKKEGENVSNCEKKNKIISKTYSHPSTSKENNKKIIKTLSENPEKSKETKLPIYEKLYTQKNNRKQLENIIYNKDELFKPKTNTYYKGLYNDKSFTQRQKIYKAKSTERKKKLDQYANPKYDLKTGQKLFQPKINKNFNSCRISNNTNLYLNARNGKLRREEFQRKLFNLEKKIHEFRANGMSDNLFENQIIKSFKKIFFILDKNQNGKISPFNYSTKELPESIKKIIYPILNEIDIKNKILNEEKFVYECKKLYKHLDYYKKKEIYNFADTDNKRNFYSISCYSYEDNIDKNDNKYSLYCLTNNDKSSYDNNISGSCHRLRSACSSKYDNKERLSGSSNYDINDYYINNNRYLHMNGRYSNYRTFYGNNFENRKRKYFDNLVIQRNQEEI